MNYYSNNIIYNIHKIINVMMNTILYGVTGHCLGQNLIYINTN